MLTAANLIALLGWWRESTDPELARAIELISPHAARGVAVAGVWRVAVHRADLVERHHLIVTLSEADRDERLARIEALARYAGRDPRVDIALVDYLRWGSHGITDTERMRVLGYLDGTRDGRILAQLPEIETAVRRYGIQTRKTTRKTLGRIRAHHARIDARPLSDDEHRFVRAVLDEATRIDERDAAIEATLLADVYAAPHDDAPRSVYADWLLERQDPRGELIALQLAHPEDTPRAKQLYEAHHRAWVGPLFGQHASLAFRRGFLATSNLRLSNVDHPILATLETCAYLPPPRAYRSVRVIRTLHDDAMLRLGELPADAAVESLEWLGSADSPKLGEVQAAYAAAPLPALRDLTVDSRQPWSRATWTPENCAWLLRDRALRSVAISGSPAQLAQWIALFAPTTVEQFALTDAFQFTLAVSRDATKRFTTLAMSSTTFDIATRTELVARGLAACVPDSLTSFTFTSKPAFAFEERDRDALRTALASHPRCKLVLP